jgi:superfamily II DNA or RNA helicase
MRGGLTSEPLEKPAVRVKRAGSPVSPARRSDVTRPETLPLAFQARWRSYQKRVLSELDTHLGNDSLHIVAAPGSGKTVLGLEVMRRLGKPALILSPPLTIRNQWQQRLCAMFLAPGSPEPEWVSLDIKAPKTVTASTYQALHAAFEGLDAEDGIRDGEEESADESGDEDDPQRGQRRPKQAANDILARLKAQNIQTLVLDEAHHLRNEWWKALTRLKSEIGKPVVVALTATPSYDVEYVEWQRYQELCGPIDAEISVPELVLQGDLCPHQDYIYFTLPRDVEAEKLARFHGEVRSFVRGLPERDEFKTALLEHAWIARPEEHVEAILDDPSFFSSILIYLHELGVKPSEKALNILGVDYDEIPALTHAWLETLLTGVLHAHRESFTAFENALGAMERDLRRMGALEHRKVRLSNPKAVQKLLSSSISKLDAIVDITRMENEALGDELRLVILSDYIRKSELPQSPTDLRPIDKMGVIPIFETLRRAGIPRIKLGVLTGSLICIPAESQARLEAIVQGLGIDPSHVRCEAADFDHAFLFVGVISEQQQNVVRLITELFAQGGITVLVGTQALLGEGWDAPSVNALILASTVGSYMQSNQMRGRAIRIDPGQPDKASNIWHLAGIDPSGLTDRADQALPEKMSRRRAANVVDDLSEDLGSDVDALKRRFRAFEGLSFREPVTIENGFRRLALNGLSWNEQTVHDINGSMKDKAADRKTLHTLWRHALKGDNTKLMMREHVRSNYVPEALAFYDAIKYLLFQAGFLIGLILSEALAWAVGTGSLASAAAIMFYGFIAGMIATLPMTARAAWLWIRNGSLEGSMMQAGWSVLGTLHRMGVIKTALRTLRVATFKDRSGIVLCRLEGATTIERSHFMAALQELLSPVENPRYVMVRRSVWWRFARTDYHAVPAAIGQKKEHAEYFARLWNDYVGSSKLVYTRSVEGRLTLLQARTKALSSEFRRTIDRISRWQ